MEDRIIELKDSSSTVSLAAKALKCEEQQIAKTLSFLLNGKPILIVTSGDAKVDNIKYKKEFQEKAHMIALNDVNDLIGHPVGGVCPFAIKEGVPVYLDISLKKLKNVYPACGSNNTAIKLSLEELEKYSLYKKWVDVCKIWQ